MADIERRQAEQQGYRVSLSPDSSSTTNSINSYTASKNNTSNDKIYHVRDFTKTPAADKRMMNVVNENRAQGNTIISSRDFTRTPTADKKMMDVVNKNRSQGNTIMSVHDFTW